MRSVLLALLLSVPLAGCLLLPLPMPTCFQYREYVDKELLTAAERDFMEWYCGGPGGAEVWDPTAVIKKRRVAPEISGTLMRGDVPAEGLRVRRCASSAYASTGICTLFYETTTGSDGRFVLPGATHYEERVRGLAVSYGIEVIVEDRALRWSYSGIGLVPEKVALECEVGVELKCTPNP